MSDSKRYPWNPYLINNVKEMVVFLTLKLFNSGDSSYMFSCSRNQVIFVRNQKLTIISFQNYKHWYLIHIRIESCIVIFSWIYALIDSNKHFQWLNIYWQRLWWPFFSWFFNIPKVLEGLKKSKKFKMFKNLLLNTKCYTRRIS